mgnify:CR=1 FL=1
MAETAGDTERSVAVWDRWVRISHWLVAGAFAAAYLSAEAVMPLHTWAGYLIGALLAIRIAWGFLGPQPARFRDFWPTPSRMIGYFRELVRGEAPRYLGHNPLGAVMIVALMASLAVTVGSGLVTYGAEEQAGPLGSFYADREAAGLSIPAPLAAAHADDDADEGYEEEEAVDGEAQEAADGHEASEHPHAETAEEVHEVAANLTLALVVLHLLGVGLSSWHERQNLVRAMIDGRKRPEA